MTAVSSRFVLPTMSTNLTPVAATRSLMSSSAAPCPSITTGNGSRLINAP